MVNSKPTILSLSREITAIVEFLDSARAEKDHALLQVKNYDCYVNVNPRIRARILNVIEGELNGIKDELKKLL